MITAVKDHFEALDVGTFPHDYSPLGEYHFKVLSGRTGSWIETTLVSSWKESTSCRKNGSWNVLVENGSKVLEQSTIRKKGMPMLINGHSAWQDAVVKTSLRPLGRIDQIGVVFRYQTSRHYYALLYTGRQAQIVWRDDQRQKVLAETPCSLSCDQYHEAVVCLKGRKITARLGEVELSAEDDHYKEGRAGFLANTPVRYTGLEVEMEDEDYKTWLKGDSEADLVIQKKRQSFPQPRLWRKIPTPGFGAGKSVRFGDLNNDGRCEILMAQNAWRMRRNGYSTISCLTAFDLEGRILWQIGEPNPDNALVTNDLPFQIHDIDGDGRKEVVFCKDFSIKVCDGETGQVKYEAPTPVSPQATDAEGFYRTVGDALYFCDLSGRGEDRELILKDRYNNIWAYTWDLEILWHYQGNTGHYPMAYDFDGDGRDELVVGYSLLAGDGSLLWELDLKDHADGIAVGSFGPGDETWIIIAASDEGMYWVDPEGKIHRHLAAGHCQTATISNLIPENEGLEVATITFWGNPGILLIYDWQGNLLHRSEPVAPRGSALSPVNWDGSGRELILLSGHPTQGGMVDGRGRRVVTFPDDGHPYLCCEPIDLIGDPRDEIVFWNTDSLWIYTQDRPAEAVPIYQPVRQQHYNMSNYRAQISLPRT